MRLATFHHHIREACTQSGKSMDFLYSYVRGLGIDAVEINRDELLEDPGLGGRLAAAGISISGIYGFHAMDAGENRDMEREHVELAERLGAPVILVIPGFLSEEETAVLGECSDEEAVFRFFDSSEKTLRMAEGLARMCDYGRERGIAVTVEDFDGLTSPLCSIAGLAWFFRQVPELGYTYDCGNLAVHGEDILEAYARFRERIVHVHLKDRKVNALASLRMPGIPVGSGVLPLVPALERLREDGYDGTYALEHFGAEDQMRAMQRSASFAWEYFRKRA